MGFRNPLTSLSADQITAGTLPPDVVSQSIATAETGRRVVISTPVGDAGRVDFYGDPDGPGQGEGHAAIHARTLGGVSPRGLLNLETDLGATLIVGSEEVAAGGYRSFVEMDADVVRQVGDVEWTAATLTSGWSYYGAPQRHPGYEAQGDHVEICGFVAGGGASSANPIFTLPSTCLPIENERFVCEAGAGFAIVSIDAAGHVWVEAYRGGSNVYVSLAGIRFKRQRP